MNAILNQPLDGLDGQISLGCKSARAMLGLSLPGINDFCFVSALQSLKIQMENDPRSSTHIHITHPTMRGLSSDRLTPWGIEGWLIYYAMQSSARLIAAARLIASVKQALKPCR